MDNDTNQAFESFLYHEYPEIVPADKTSLTFLEEQARLICGSLGIQRSIETFQSMTAYGSIEFSFESHDALQTVDMKLYDSTPEYGDVIASMSIDKETHNIKLSANRDASYLVRSAIDAIMHAGSFSESQLESLYIVSKLFSRKDTLMQITEQAKVDNLAVGLTQLIGHHAVARLQKQMYVLSSDITTLELERFKLIEIQSGNNIDSDALYIMYHNEVEDTEYKYYKDENDNRSLEVNVNVNQADANIARFYNKFSVKHVGFLSKLLLDVHIRDLQNS